MSQHGTVHDDLEAYVIDALDRSDRARFESHLPSCEACRAEIATYGRTLDALGAIAVPPPPPIPRPRATAPGRFRVAWFAALAAACVIGIGVSVSASFERERVHERAYAEIARMLATDPIEVALVGPNGASGRAIVGEGRARSGFVVRGLPAPAPGYVYRVWVRDAVTRRSPGVLERTADGLDILVTAGDAIAGTRSIRIMLESESLEAADRSPRKQVLDGPVG